MTKTEKLSTLLKGNKENRIKEIQVNGYKEIDDIWK